MAHITDWFMLLGGIALFLYGINYMTSAIQSIAGDKLRVILEKATKNGILAFLLGTLVTALIQSSGACGVMTIGFISAELMTLTQGLYVMLGANIGTTITSWIISFKIETVAPLILFLGMVMMMFIKNRTVKRIGEIILGFGMLFVGIFLMGEATSALELGSIISSFLDRFSNPLLSVLFGLVFTFIIQSSSASIGILQVLAMSANSSLTLESVLFIILGMNIGACAPIVIAGLGGNRFSKRAALGSLFTKILGALVFSVIISVCPFITDGIESLFENNVPRQIAAMHLVFNLVSSLILIPFVGMISKLLMKIMPDTEKDTLLSKRLLYITPEADLTPSIAIMQAKREILRMGHLAEENIVNSVHACIDRDVSKLEDIGEKEKTINFLNHEITGYLIQLHSRSMPEKDIETIGMMFHVVNDIERLGDHAENISEYAQQLEDTDIWFSDEAYHELKLTAQTAVECVTLSLDVYESERFDLLPRVQEMEEAVDSFEEEYTQNHIERLKEGLCSPTEGVLFTDMITDLERCSDHAINIAYAINGEKSNISVKKSFVMTKGSSVN